jgi:malate dehydrogenase (oxaloacetate-decarboxylating)
VLCCCCWQANLGIARLLVAALRQRGLSEQAAKTRIWLIDRQGLITTDRQGLSPGKAAFAGDPARLKRGVDATWQRTSSSDSRQLHAQLAAAVEATQATTLIGAAAVPGAFGRPVIEALTRVSE